jgi:hypothetical protein
VWYVIYSGTGTIGKQVFAYRADTKEEANEFKDMLSKDPARYVVITTLCEEAS